MSQELMIPEFRDVTVVATTREQMEHAQHTLVSCAESRLAALTTEIEELEINLGKARAYKLRLTTIQGAIGKARRRVVFYEKLKAAFLAGYTLIPDMNVDVFAIRTSAASPSGTGRDREPNANMSPWISDQTTNRAPLGEGRYVSVRADQDSTEVKPEKSADGTKILRVFESWATEFREEIPFPFALAKPQIMDLTHRAMGLRIFDEIGGLPRRRGADPMVIGRIVLKEGYTRKTVNFLIAWFVDTKEL